MDRAVLDDYTPPRNVDPSDDEEWLDTRQPMFPYPDAEELVRTYFASYLDVDCFVAEKTAEWRDVIDHERVIIKEDLRMISGLTDQRARWFWTEVLKALSPQAKRMREALRQIARLQRLDFAARRVFGVRDLVGSDAAFDEKVARARQIPILDVVSQLLEVKNRGKSYVALCPFHEDKNPSLHIYPDTNTFYCFGCQKAGDAIGFVRLHLGYGFRQAVEYLLGGIEDERTRI
jgi:hypothetical protein